MNEPEQHLKQIIEVFSRKRLGNKGYYSIRSCVKNCLEDIKYLKQLGNSYKDIISLLETDIEREINYNSFLDAIKVASKLKTTTTPKKNRWADLMKD